MSYKEFVEHQGGFYDHERMYSPCFDWLADKDDTLMSLDFIGRFENLENDFAAICRLLKIDAKLVHANKTNNKLAYDTYYDKKSKEILARKFKKDIEQFGY